MVAWDFSLTVGDPPFKVAALGFEFPVVGFGGGIEKQTRPCGAASIRAEDQFCYLAAPYRAD
jgi:hypothetical protein